MSPLIAYHATPMRHRNSIAELGLLACCPMKGRPYGVYVFSNAFDHPVFSRARRSRAIKCKWDWQPPSDLWQVAYIGPLSPDHYVANAMILHERVPPQCLSLITHITPNADVRPTR